MTKMNQFALVAILVAGSFSAACGSNTPTGPKQGANPTATPTVASTPVPDPKVIRIEVRTTCGGSNTDGTTVSSEVVNPPYILAFRKPDVFPFCLRVLQNVVPDSCPLTWSITTDQKVVMFHNSNTWERNDIANYPPWSAGQLPHRDHEQSLADFGLTLNPGTYPFKVKLSWDCAAGKGDIDTFEQIIMDSPPNQ